MKYWKLLVGLLLLPAFTACDDSGVTGPRSRGDVAPVRVLNAAIDVGPVDFSFIDEPENLPTFKGLAPRAHSGMYQGVLTGTRPLRVFPNNDTLSVTSTILVEQQLPLATGNRYTLVYAGSATAGTDQVVVLNDPATMPAPAAGNIGIRVLNAGTGMGSVDVYVVPVAATTTATPADWQTNNAGVISGVGELTQTTHANLPALADGFYRFVVTAAGSSTPLFAATPNLPGAAAPAGASYGDQPGVRISGSVLTLVVASGTVSGTRGSTTANQSPTAFLWIDKTLDP
ncbi:MAG TPA: DUF4397 domain-containing protein [Longimicrobiales bacterium]